MKIFSPITEFAEALADVEALQNAMATGIRYTDEGLIDLSKVPVAALTVLCSSHGESNG